MSWNLGQILLNELLLKFPFLNQEITNVKDFYNNNDFFYFKFDLRENNEHFMYNFAYCRGSMLVRVTNVKQPVWLSCAGIYLWTYPNQVSIFLEDVVPDDWNVEAFEIFQGVDRILRFRDLCRITVSDHPEKMKAGNEFENGARKLARLWTVRGDHQISG